MQFKRTKKHIDGIILLDKPIGYSSNKALQAVKHLFKAAKAGHTGTLDPLATGVLPLCFGEATKFAQHLTDADKTYIATLKLGVTTTTGDAEGEVLAQRDVGCSKVAFETACHQFVGNISQTPPMYSALKHEGKPLYEYARAGIEVERPARQVAIHEIVVNDFADDVAIITVTCSKGTYIRTLAEDIGESLGCGSHLIGLRRTKTANYMIENTITLEALEGIDDDARLAILQPVDSAISEYPSIVLTDADVARVRQGQMALETVKEVIEMHRSIRMYDEKNNFIGVGEKQANGHFAPKRLIVQKTSSK